MSQLEPEATILIERMCRDWDKQSAAMRKAWAPRETIQLHAICGGFLYFMTLLKSKVPVAEYEKHKTHLLEQFHMGFLDCDISHALETTVPPGTMHNVGFLRRDLCRLIVTQLDVLLSQLGKEQQ